MSNWNEDNFLEKLVPQLRRELGTEQNSCPDSATLCAVMDGEASAWLRHTFSGHLVQCPTCAHLYRRLQDFGKGELPEHDAEWERADKRLHNWFQSSFGLHVV